MWAFLSTMNLNSFALLVTLSTCYANTGNANELPKPENVTLLTLNTDYLLTWDWMGRIPSNGTITTDKNVTFTTEYLAKYKYDRKKKTTHWTQVCVRYPDTRCNLTSCGLHYMGMYVLRVRASVGDLNSNWVLKDFCPDKDAKLGPPSRVELAAVNNLLDVSISDPLTSTGESMRKHVPFLSYDVYYWRPSADPQGVHPKKVNTTTTLVTLPDLEPWTFYCVAVQSRYDYYHKFSYYSPTKCMKTEGTIPTWQIVLYALTSMVVVFLLVLLLLLPTVKCYQVLKSNFYPSIPHIPNHIQEYLCDPSPGSDMPRLLTPESEEEFFCDKLSLYPAAAILEVHSPSPLLVSSLLAAPPSVLERNDSGDRHSRQDSGDSGVYSTEGGSTQQLRGNSRLPIRSFEDPCQSQLIPEHMKMKKMAGDQTDEGMMDEGVTDMCV